MTSPTDGTPRGTHRAPRPVRRRFAPAALVAGVAASAAIALSMTGTLGAFAASITNSTNNAATGTLTMQEQNSGATVTCTSNSGTSIGTNSATCANINKYGGSTTMVPGSSVSTTVTIKNTGTVPANTFTLAPGGCTSGNATTSGGATDACAKFTLSLTQDGTAITLPTTSGQTGLNAFANKTATLNGPIAAGTTSTFVFTVTFPSQGSTSADNAYQGVTVSQPLVWTFTS